ncbi:MAG: class I SAM-dependent methyltransferase [Aggregatilineales bacterium]
MTSNVQQSYNHVAQEYARRIYGELAHKSFDRKMLDWLAEKINRTGIICDIGCGPGQIARYLADQGVQACGIDLSPGMIEQAKRLNPGIPFQVGNMLALTEVVNNAFSGIAGFYSIIHIPHEQILQALQEFERVLCPNGVALLAFHIGNETRHLDEWWGEKVSMDFQYFSSAEIKASLQAAGFVVEEVIERDPYPEVEVQTRRAYLFARKAS